MTRGILNGMYPDDELRDEPLTRALRTALSGETAPEAWRAEARRVPVASRRAVAEPERESILPLIVPHLCGLIVLVGVVASIFVLPGIQRAFGDLLGGLAGGAPAPRAVSGGAASPVFILGLILPLLFVALILEASQGFRHVKHWTR